MLGVLIIAAIAAAVVLGYKTKINTRRSIPVSSALRLRISSDVLCWASSPKS